MPSRYPAHRNVKLSTDVDDDIVLEDIYANGPDEELGDVGGFGWYGMAVNIVEPPYFAAIVHEDNYGFKDVTTFGTIREAEDAWDELEAEYREWLKESDWGDED